MIEYPHIDTIYKRYMEGPDKGRIIEGAWTHPEFEYLANNKWVGTEKIDGMNIRICWYPHGPDIGIPITGPPSDSILVFKGKTDKAQPYKPLWDRLNQIFTIDLMSQVFPDHPVCLYGEGYGKGIQKGGKYIPDGINFILIDIRIGEWWLQYADCARIAERLNIGIVPILGEFNLYEAIAYVKFGILSRVAQWHNHPMTDDVLAEGLVLKLHYDLRFRNGQRIITKIKHKDFRRK